MVFKLKTLTFFWIIFFFYPALLVSAQSNENSEAPLRVITKTIEPFVMAGSDTGFSIDLLHSLVERMGYEYQLMERVLGVNDLLVAVENNEADMAIAAITINSERDKRVDFSHSMFDSGLQILVSQNQKGSKFRFSILMPLFKIVGGLIFLMFIVANIVWFSERKKNTDFSERYLVGVWEAFWWSAVTITTVGYGDKVPRGILGRIIGITWMFLGLFLIAYFTSSITSTLTVESLQSSINGFSDLIGKSVGTVENTTSDRFLQSKNISPVGFKTISEAYQALEEGKIEAIVYDAPVLQYYAATDGLGKVKTVGKIFQKEQYGIAFPSGSSLRKMTNTALLKLKEDGTYQQIQEKWFGVSE